MAVFGLSIEKEVGWRNEQERFANVYHYSVLGGITDPAVDELVNAVIAAERLVHSSAVRFVTARFWEAGGSPAENEMLLVRDLNTVGDKSAVGGFFRELAYLVQWELPRKSRTGRKVYLRKWIHSCTNFATAISSESSGASPLGTPQLSPLNAYAGSVESWGLPLIGADLCSPSGEVPTAPAVVFPYLEHRQFRGRGR